MIKLVIACALATVVLAQQCSPTAKDILGPYYQPGAPNRTNEVCQHSPALDRLIITGVVKDTNCKPLPFTKLDIWQANERGQYSEGSSKGSDDFTCRSVIYSDANGVFKFQTIFPGRYDDDGYRPAHIHFTVTAKDSQFKPFTTQLYFKKDYYLYPRDSCGHCNSKDASLVSEVIHLEDIKTYVGKWDIVLASGDNKLDRIAPQSDSYTQVKSDIMPSKQDIVDKLIKQLKALQNKL